jgi:hypothetical protein
LQCLIAHLLLQAERLRYFRAPAIRGSVIAIPVWVLLFVYGHGVWPVVLLAATTTASSILNIGSLTWRISRAQRDS